MGSCPVRLYSLDRREVLSSREGTGRSAERFVEDTIPPYRGDFEIASDRDLKEGQVRQGSCRKKEHRYEQVRSNASTPLQSGLKGVKSQSQRRRPVLYHSDLAEDQHRRVSPLRGLLSQVFPGLEAALPDLAEKGPRLTVAKVARPSDARRLGRSRLTR
jgi:hypothetical protein